MLFVALQMDMAAIHTARRDPGNRTLMAVIFFKKRKISKFSQSMLKKKYVVTLFLSSCRDSSLFEEIFLFQKR